MPPARGSQRGASGQGSIRQLPSGRWAGEIRLPGSGRRFYTTADSQRAVVKALHKAREDAERGLRPGDATLTVGAWLTQWLNETVKPYREPRTHASYEQYVRLYWLPTIGKKRLGKLTVGDVQAVLTGMGERGLSPRTVTYARAVLRRALNVAIRHELIGRNVAALAEVPRARPHETPAMPIEQARAILAAVKGSRLETLVLVTLALGLRQAEVLGLTWDRIDFDAGTMRIDRTLHRRKVNDGARMGTEWELRPAKTTKSRRVIPLPQVIQSALKAHDERGVRDWTGNANFPTTGLDLVFTSTRGTPLDGPNVTHRFQAMLASHGLPIIRFHDLRHGSASFLCSLNVPLHVAMAILGHSQASTLLNVYAHANQDDMQAALDAYGKLLDGADDVEF